MTLASRTLSRYLSSRSRHDAQDTGFDNESAIAGVTALSNVALALEGLARF